MPVSIIVGGQYGSEGKGKVAAWVAKKNGAKVVVRCGGPNSGHTVIHKGKPVIFQHLPTACLDPEVISVLPPGTYIDLDILFREIEITGIHIGRLIIDPNAVIITRRHKAAECRLRKTIGFTATGTGAALIARIQREKDLATARDIPALVPFIQPTLSFFYKMLRDGQRIIIEGTQGYGLSLLHSPHYPKATARDTTAAGFLSETGLSPLDVDDVVLVLRTFPIRVPGNSGPLAAETNWHTVNEESGAPIDLTEKTSVTKAVRRIGRFDPTIVRKAIQANNPTRIVLNHLDLIDYECRNGLTRKGEEFISTVSKDIGKGIQYYGAGPDHGGTYGLGTTHREAEAERVS